MVIAIVGPTGVGKTKMSVELAKKLNGEIINADSTQVYIGADIATAKVTEKETEGIPHHLFDFKNLEESYTVYDYQKDCRKKIDEIIKKGKIPILVGGTGLYVKAALYDYQFVEMSYHNEYEEVCTSELFLRLKKIDPETTIHPNNRKRIVRSLNYYEETKMLLSQKEKTETLLYPCVFIGLTMERDLLYQRINHRVEQMIQDGLLEEAKKMFDSHIRTKAVLTPIGYKELFPYFEGEKTLEWCLEEIKKNSRKYAKRQYTWFRNQVPVTWFSVDVDHFDQTVSEVFEFIDTFDFKKELT